MCVYVYTHAHTHTVQMGHMDVSPGVGMRHLEGPKNPDGLNLDIHIFVSVYKVHKCIYMLRGGMRSWTNCFGPKLGTYSDWGLSSVLVINKHLSHHVFSFEKSRRCDDN